MPVVDDLRNEIYRDYNDILKPLLADVEAKWEMLPLPIHNEIRSCFDHMARCHLPDVNSEQMEKDIRKAKDHIKRAILDSFKNLNLYYHDKYSDFEKAAKKYDMTTIADGEFFFKYKGMRQQAINLVRDAKKTESRNFEEALRTYEKAYLKYIEIDDLFDGSLVRINAARRKHVIFSVGKFCLWFVSIVVSVLLGLILSPVVVSWHLTGHAGSTSSVNVSTAISNSSSAPAKKIP